MKFQKFHLSTIISYIFFILFITLLLGSALWFYTSSLKTIEDETKNYFKQNSKIVEIILDSYASNLSDLTRQIVSKYNFKDSNIQNIQTQEYLEKVFNSNIDHKLDFMFLSSSNGKIIDVSLTIFDSKIIINRLLKYKSSETFFFKNIKVDGQNSIAVLVSTEKIIDSYSGKLLGKLYAGIILNDNFSIITDINSRLKNESLSFILDDKIIASSTSYDNKLFPQIQSYIKNLKINELKIKDILIAKRSKIKIKDKQTPIEIISIIKNDTFDKFYTEFLYKLFILIFLCLILFIIAYKMIKGIIEIPLNRLMIFASKSLENKHINHFEETRIMEFNKLGYRFEKLIKEVKKVNSGLELKIKERTSELEESNDELHFTIENLKNTQNKLVEVEKMASLGNLVAGIAHEVNTPVGIGVTGITHILEITKKIEQSFKNDDLTEDELKNYLESTHNLAMIINTNLDRTAQLVKSFKQVAVDQTSEEKRVFNLKEYINSILFSIDNIIKQTNLKIEIICDDNVNINSYPGALSQIITNLIINSSIHGFKEKEKGDILIEFTQKDNEILFVYKDNGQGIEEKNLEKIFDPFFTTNREKGGTGLGLHIIYNIITHTLKGNIQCVSKKGDGVKFSMKFSV